MTNDARNRLSLCSSQNKVALQESLNPERLRQAVLGFGRMTVVNGGSARRACTLLPWKEVTSKVDNIMLILKLATAAIGLARELVAFAKACWPRKKEDR